MKGSYIAVPTTKGETFDAYVVRPAQRARAAVVVIQEIFGVNAYIRGVCDALAEKRFAALAPDIFWRLERRVELGYDEEGRKKAMALLDAFDQEAALDDIADAARFLRGADASFAKLAVLGFCVGGRLSYLAAANGGFDAAVVYYAVGLEKVLDSRAPACPTIIHFGDRDRFAPAEVMAEIKKSVAKRPNIALHVYPGCEHAFASPDHPAFDAEATRVAEERSLEFLARSLAG